MAVVISWPVAAYVFLVLAVIFALMFAVTFSGWFLRMGLPHDGASMNDDEPTLDTRGPHDR